MDPTKCEFPTIPDDFDQFQTSPKIFDFATHRELILENHSKFAVLFKVKCTSNKRIKIEHCADILLPGNLAKIPIENLVDEVSGDSLHVIFTLVGPQWHDARMSAYKCWMRAKKQSIKTKTTTIRVKKKKSEKEKEKKSSQSEKRRRERSEEEE